MFKKLSAALMMLAVMAVPALATAHVVVTPGKVGVGASQSFSLGVPNEKAVAVTGLRIVLPAGLQEVTPNVKPGWTVDEKKTGTGEETSVTEISWTGGSIPSGQRDDFLFRAQVPASATELHWKAYQMYEDGTVVSWDQTPSGSDDATGDKGPYSVTEVVNDLDKPTTTSKSDTTLPIVLSVLALVVSAAGFVTRKK